MLRSLMLCVLSCLLVVAFARPCSRDDFGYDFSECHEGPPGAGPVREAFAYPKDCDLRAHNSSILPQPALDLPCEQPCASNHYLKIKDDVRSSKLKVSCLPCPRGRFSLGGGLLMDGSSGDWSRPWPEGLKTSCLYRSSDASWVLGGGARLTCVLHVNSLALETRAGTWNQNLPDQQLHVPLEILQHDACGAVDRNLTGTAVLVLRGQCPFSTKTQHISKAGAKVVIVYNNLYKRPHFYPAAANGTQPSIPIFMLTREDGEQIITEKASGRLSFEVSSTRCSLDRREVAPSSNESTTEGSSENSEGSWEATPDKGCADWGVDPSGTFLHSGDNHDFHWLYSFLTFSTRFVRDGYIRFRYAVDAEDGYDGLLFEMDGNLVWNRTVSLEAPWRDFRLQVPRGSHTFTWTYKKDFSTSSGEDRARLELLEVSGTAHSDSECRSCSLLSSPGSGRCLSCSRDQFSEMDSKGVIHCVKCPANTWAPAASKGQESCRTRRPCTAQDVEVFYLPGNLSGAHSSPGSFCRNNRTIIRARWRRPVTCISAQSPKRLVGITGGPRKPKPCPPCQPKQWRPNGEICVNRPQPRCSPPLYAILISRIKYWHTWPQNFTSWIWGRSSQDEPHAWKLRPDGNGTVVGSAYLGEEADSYADQALLTYNVDLTTAGELVFALEEKPAGAWGQGGALYVDHQPREADRIGNIPSGHTWKLKLKAGWHSITWVWRYKGPQPEEQAADADARGSQGSGVRLLRVSVTNARGAPAGGCERCPAHHGWRGVDRCEPCPPGTEEIDGLCKACAAGYANPREASRCVKCGPGTSSIAGHRCKINTTVGGDGHLSWDSNRFLKTWRNKTQDAGGFRRIIVEDRTYYMNLLQPMQLPGASMEFRAHKAYVWEALPPRMSDVGTCPTESSFVRPVADLLEAVKPNEGRPSGLWFNFLGRCFRNGEAAQRRLHLLLSCHPDADPLQDFSLLSALEPPSDGGCEDLALEWRTLLACPVCQEGDWEAVTPTRCDPVRGQRVTFVAPSDCFGGAKKPKDYWEPCPGVLNLVALVIVGAVVGCILCCLSIYVLLLRRRYAKYMMLEEGSVTNVVAPASIGVPDSPANFA